MDSGTHRDRSVPSERSSSVQPIFGMNVANWYNANPCQAACCDKIGCCWNQALFLFCSQKADRALQQNPQTKEHGMHTIHNAHEHITHRGCIWVSSQKALREELEGVGIYGCEPASSSEERFSNIYGSVIYMVQVLHAKMRKPRSTSEGRNMGIVPISYCSC